MTDDDEEFTRKDVVTLLLEVDFLLVQTVLDLVGELIRHVDLLNRVLSQVNVRMLVEHDEPVD